MDNRGSNRSRRIRRLVGRWLLLSASLLSLAVGAAQAPVPLTTEARRDLARWVLAQRSVIQIAPGHRLAAIRVAAATTADASGKARTIVTAVLFDHTALEARRVTMDGTSGEILSDERLPGRPQSSADEFEEAVQIVRRDAELARLLDGGAVLDGGFIVDDPGGSRRRMIQLKLMSADRRTPLRTITVDLTRRRLAAVGR
jgi:hypothetical protein